MNAGKKCLAQRIKLKMTLGELSRDSGVKPDSLREFERGGDNLHPDQVEKVADALMLKSEYVLSNSKRVYCEGHEHGCPCFFNRGINCFDQSCCYQCAWNPEIARTRKQLNESNRKVLYENFLY